MSEWEKNKSVKSTFTYGLSIQREFPWQLNNVWNQLEHYVLFDNPFKNNEMMKEKEKYQTTVGQYQGTVSNCLGVFAI